MDALVSRCCRSSMVITMNMTDDVQYLYVAQWWKSDCRALDVCVCVSVCVRCCSLGLLGFFGTLFLLRLGRKNPKTSLLESRIYKGTGQQTCFYGSSHQYWKHTLQTFHFNYCSWLKHTLQKNRIKKNLIHALGMACVSSTRQNKHLSTCLFNYASAFSWC